MTTSRSETPAPLTPEERREAVAQAHQALVWADGSSLDDPEIRSLATNVLSFDAALAAVEQERDAAKESFDVVAARMIGSELEVERLKAQLAEARELVDRWWNDCAIETDAEFVRLLCDALASVSGADATEKPPRKTRLDYGNMDPAGITEMLLDADAGVSE